MLTFYIIVIFKFCDPTTALCWLVKTISGINFLRINKMRYTITNKNGCATTAR